MGDMSDLVKRLRIKAGMIDMGEMIAWGSDSALMREAADALELAAPAVQWEPVAYAVFADSGNIRIWSTDPIQAEALRLKHGDQVRPLYTAPQPVEQQSGVTGLVEALELIAESCDVGRHDGLPEDGPALCAAESWLIAKGALAAYRRGVQS